MILVLARAAGCSWTVVKELLLMYVVERTLHSDDLNLMHAFERYRKLGEETARRFVLASHEISDAKRSEGRTRNLAVLRCVP